MYLGLIFGILGFIMKKGGYPPHAAILGIVLGPLAETYFMRGLRLSGGSITIFFDAPLKLSLWGVFFISAFWPFISAVYKKLITKN
jgi:putative tricarboxylic transport membrane protein